MNEIFSGGFGSRVFQSVRTKLGLAYSVGGSFGAAYDHPGAFYSAAGTKSASAPSPPPRPSSTRSAASRPSRPPRTRCATPRTRCSTPSSSATTRREKTLNEQVTLAFYGYPPDFLEKYKDGIEKVTAADVTRVANKYIDVSKLAIVVVGNKSEIKPALSTLGPVTNLDIAIPPPPGAKAKQPGASAE